MSAEDEAGELPDALAMLKLLPDVDAYMRKVSEAISPKPWPHNWTLCRDEADLYWCMWCNQTYSFGRDMLEWQIAHKVTYGESVRVLNETECGCSVPPKLTDPPEVVAFRLRDEMVKSVNWRDRHSAKCAIWKMRGAPHADGCAVSGDWYGDYATPHEQIAVALVALGKWRVNNGQSGGR